MVQCPIYTGVVQPAYLEQNYLQKAFMDPCSGKTYPSSIHILKESEKKLSRQAHSERERDSVKIKPSHGRDQKFFSWRLSLSLGA
jgi:hypothetical protein